ncbi:hypothetical protein [Geoglobus acetivorans]
MESFICHCVTKTHNNREVMKMDEKERKDAAEILKDPRLFRPT